jgi:adenosylcobinamide-GDP ribazoletransferase
MRSPRGALSFLTPIGGASVPSPADLGWFPVVGAAIGAVLGLVWWGAAHAWPPAVAAALVLVCDLALTGLLHFDGLVDSADGLLPHLTRTRRLEVMTEPTVGAFGVSAAALAIVVRFAALASTRPSVILLVGIWCGSRTLMAVTTSVLPYARDEGGLASSFRAPGRQRAFVTGTIGLAGTLVCAMFWHPLGGAVAVATATLCAAGVLWLSLRRLGGFTGDVLGASGVVFETVGLLVAAARWS